MIVKNACFSNLLIYKDLMRVSKLAQRSQYLQ